jgi:hypothetical protein
MVFARPHISRELARSGGFRGSNEALNSLARMVNAEMTGAALPSAPAR